MNPQRSRAKGVELLRLYIQYARSRGTNLGVGDGLSHVPLNPFEADIADALEREGTYVLPQWERQITELNAPRSSVSKRLAKLPGGQLMPEEKTPHSLTA